MIHIGTRINSYIVTAIANGYVLAASSTAPDPFVVWSVDADGSGVHTGRYFNDRMEAEWEFCGLAFEWFQDNVNINYVDEEYERDSTEARAAALEENLSAAHRSLAAAMELVEDLFLEHERLCPKEDRVTDESIEKVARDFAEDMVSKGEKHDTFDTALAMLDSLKVRQQLRKEALTRMSEAAQKIAPQEEAAERNNKIPAPKWTAVPKLAIDKNGISLSGVYLPSIVSFKLEDSGDSDGTFILDTKIEVALI